MSELDDTRREPLRGTSKASMQEITTSTAPRLNNKSRPIRLPCPPQTATECLLPPTLPDPLDLNNCSFCACRCLRRSSRTCPACERDEDVGTIEERRRNCCSFHSSSLLVVLASSAREWRDGTTTSSASDSSDVEIAFADAGLLPASEAVRGVGASSTSCSVDAVEGGAEAVAEEAKPPDLFDLRGLLAVDGLVTGT